MADYNPGSVLKPDHAGSAIVVMLHFRQNYTPEVLELFARILCDFPDKQDFEVRASLAIIQCDLCEDAMGFTRTSGSPKSDLIRTVLFVCLSARRMKQELLGLGNVAGFEEIGELIFRNASEP